MRKRELKTMLGGGVVATLMCKSSLHADAFGTSTSNTGPFADSVNHNYCILDPGNWNQSGIDMVHGAMDYLAGYTDMTESWVATCTNSTDVRWETSNLPGTTRGQNSCRVALDSMGRCGSSRDEIDAAQIWADAQVEWPNVVAANNRNVQKTIDHEIGHSVGMTHWPNPQADLDGDGAVDDFTLAMESGHVFDDNATLYTQHHKDHVNNAY